MEQQNCIFRFADIELNERNFSVTKAGEVLPIEPKVFKVLQFLLHNPGRAVTKDELLNAVWNDCTVSESSLSRSVATLRRLLGDDTREPLYIATIPTVGYRFLCNVQVSEDGVVPASASIRVAGSSIQPLLESHSEILPTRLSKTEPGKHRLNWLIGGFAAAGRGYRFIGALEGSIQPVGSEVMVGPEHGARRGGVWWKIGAVVLAVPVIALAAFVAYRWHRQREPQEQAVLTPVPFTALPGLALNPAFSPDGSRIAFAWSPTPQAKGDCQVDLYVKALGSETLLRLTQHPSENLFPAWSPDGTHIAFRRVAYHDSGIYMVPELGGPEQKLHSSQDLDPTISWSPSTISWSPDGKWIAFADIAQDDNHAQVYLLSTETLATRRIPVNPKCVGEDFPTFSHNGKYLAYWCSRSSGTALVSLSLSDGKSKMVTPFWAVVPTGLTWSGDDLRLIYSRLNGTVQRGNGTNSTKLLGEVSVANGSEKLLGLEGFNPAVSSKGDKLAYGTRSLITHLWRRDLLHPEAQAVELIPSSRSQYEPQYSPDGRHIAFSSLRSGMQSVWISDEDGGNLVQISDPSYMSGSPQWSPDGKKIVFDARPRNRWKIYVADVDGGKPGKLVTNISSIIRPSWSRDGKWIYFISNDPPINRVYRCSASGGDATLLSKDIHAGDPLESFDGKTVYFGVGTTLKAVALQGQPGTETEVDPSLRLVGPQSWVLSPRGIYFIPAEAPNSVRYFEFANKRIRTIFETDRQLGTGLSVSPDNRWILYEQIGDLTGDIMLVDHFR